MSVKDKLIVALDTNDLAVAEVIITDLAGLTGPFKIGLEAINAGIAHELAQMVISAGGKVFWDGKFLDIPNTVAGATKGLLKRLPQGLWALNVHASGGEKMMAAAVENRGEALVLAVTVLTSLSDPDALRLFHHNVSETVGRWSTEATRASVQGLICSPQEAKQLRGLANLNELLLVTPAIRPDWSVPQDQARPTTPKQALENGADLIVVGRPITDPPKASGHTRRTAAEAILEEMATGIERAQVA